MSVLTLETRERVFAGILFTSLSYFLFTVHDAVVKLLVVAIPVWQVLFFRSLTILAGCLIVGGRPLFAEAVRSPIVKPMFLRSFLIMAAWLCFYTAARDLQLAELTTIYYAAPIIVTVLSVLMLKEKVPLARWARRGDRLPRRLHRLRSGQSRLFAAGAAGAGRRRDVGAVDRADAQDRAAGKVDHPDDPEQRLLPGHHRPAADLSLDKRRRCARSPC